MEKTDLLKKTKLLDYDDCLIQSLIYERGWRDLSEYDAIGAVYHFVKDEILFGYNKRDTLTASEGLSDGIGQCNTKSNLTDGSVESIGYSMPPPWIYRIKGFPERSNIGNCIFSGSLRNCAYMG